MRLLDSVWNVFAALGELGIVLAKTLFPWLPLFVWIAFWLFAVNWKQLYPTLLRGGLVGLLLLAGLSVLVWGTLSPPPGGQHHLYGLHFTNLAGKLVYVTGLLAIALLCGSVQLTGALNRWCRFDADEEKNGISDNSV